MPEGTAQTISLTGASAALAQGTVASTGNPQVALYTMTLPFPGSVTINFGTDTTYGRQTWTQSAGTGNVLWKLGQGGDFTLVGGTDPVDWQYSQHDPSIVSSNSAGIFSLILMDNGDDRPTLTA